MVLKQPTSSLGNNMVRSLPKVLHWNKFQMEKIIKCKKQNKKKTHYKNARRKQENVL